MRLEVTAGTGREGLLPSCGYSKQTKDRKHHKNSWAAQKGGTEVARHVAHPGSVVFLPLEMTFSPGCEGSVQGSGFGRQLG